MKLTNLRFKPQFLAIVIVSLLFVCTPAIKAQTTPTPAMMQMLTGELQKRGLTEVEVRSALLKEGIDLENTPTAEFPKYQARVTAVLDKLEADKKAGAGNTNAAPVNVSVITAPQGQTTGGNSSTPMLKNPVTTSQEAALETANSKLIGIAEANAASNNIYGQSLLQNKSLDVYRTTDGAQAPDTYVLGEGDEVHITIFGASQTDIQQRIAADGSIQPAGVAKMFLKGLNLAQARDLIRKNLSSSYSYRPDQIAVTIVTARTILVNVFGEINIPGGFNVSALNSAINVLSVAGGTSAIGSVRNIQLIRGNTQKNIDLYAFMNDPSVQYKYDLQNNDIIYVPVIQKLITVEGAVNRPMKYEMVKDETLTDLIHYAGGLKMNAYPSFVQIKRFMDGEQKLMEWNLTEVQSGKVKVPLMNGDVIRIDSINKPMDQYVDVEGSVYYPGRFDLKANATLTALLAKAKPTYEAKTDILFVERVRADSTVQLMTVSFPNLQNGTKDFDLQARDRVRIVDQKSYRDIDSIAVNGFVRNPFKKPFSLTDHITVKKAIEMAGGLKASVFPVAYIFRKNILNPVEMQYIRVELDKSDALEMQAGDQLNIYDNASYTNVGELKIFGAVKQTRSFTYDSSMSVRDLIINAGGFALGAAFNRVEVFRTTLSPTEKNKMREILLEVDSSYNVIRPAGFSLQPYDNVVVRMIPEFDLGRVVELNGQVKYPGTYLLESKQTSLSDVVKMAGGLLDDADPYGATLFRTYKGRGNISMNIRKAMVNQNSYAQNPILFEGDVVNVNRLENTVSIKSTGTRMEQYSLDTTSVNKNVVFHGSKNAARYIRSFAGGFQKRADRNSVTVTYPNNEMHSTRRFLFFRVYPKVVSGSTISLNMDEERIQRDLEPREKIDIETSVGKALATITSTLSLILLLQRL